MAHDPDESPKILNLALAPIAAAAGAAAAAAAHRPLPVDVLLDQLIGRPPGGAW